ncbi:hypothetical protein [Chryseosolibacter indicus]|uniref:Uncharacterized protein n=1 Tax=Chryseosolibacter indicus TaxID=2782351 RepID=A0ABS5VNE1_9BACT|nr:hypothetical protein [Chryseosolibacter indicus]MBT1702955.1 hypothetical protein [Chryseosolibacter indicus]
MRGIFNALGLVILVVVVGCSSRVVPSTTTETKTIVHDSIIIKEVPRIDTVLVPGEKIVVTELIECDSVTNKPKAKSFKAKGKLASVEVEIKEDGSATATGGCDSLQAVVTAMDKEIRHYKHEQKERNKEVVKTQLIYRTRGIDIFCRTFTGLVLFFILLVLINKLKPLKFF